LRRLSVALLLALNVAAVGLAQSVFINEFHYDNTGTDAGEFVEIAGPAGTNLTGWSVVLYNGNGGAVYATLPLAGSIANQSGGFGTVSVAATGLQNGAPDGIALVNNGALVQFLCYEGTFAGVGGAAGGVTCTDVGVSQSGSEPLGSSLRLTGTGSVYTDFTWSAGLSGASAGAVNAGQTFSGVVTPTVTIAPTSGAAGTSVPVTITGINTHFDGTTAVTAGAGITVGTITVLDATHLNTTFNIAPAASAGARTVTAQTGAEVASTTFTVTTAVSLIHDIQGTGATSPLVGTTVTLRGVVVGDFQGTGQLGGFYVQEETADHDSNPATSEGIFVASTTAVAVGEQVEVTGTVSEEFGLTQIKPASNVTVLGAGSSISPTVVDFPVASATFLEQYEGMLITITDAMTVTETFVHGRFNELLLSEGGRLFVPTNVVLPGAPAAAMQTANNLRSIILDDDRNGENLEPVVYPEGGLSANNTARVGEMVDGAITGILDYGFSNYRIRPTAAVTFLTTLQNPRPTVPNVSGGTIRVSGMNVLNYFTTFGSRGAENQTEFDRQYPKIVDAIRTMNPHVLGVNEIENNGNTAMADLVNRLNALDPGKWQFVNTGTVGTDQIRVGFLYQPAVVNPVGAPQVLDASVDPRAVTTLNRPTIAQTFERIGVRSDLQRFTVVVNHFKSKGSDCNSRLYSGVADVDQNDGQGNCNLTRTSMAAALRDWLASATFGPTAVAERRFLIVGDLNAYGMEDPTQALTSTSFVKVPVIPAASPNATLIDLTKLYVPTGAYSYVFDGQSGNLDHALASPAMEKLMTSFTEFHINADEPVYIDYNLNFKSPAQNVSMYAANMYRSSDHDPVVVTFNPRCGDLNDDGLVDVADQTLLRARYGQSAAGANRRYDYDRNGTINSNDYRAWLTCQRQ
jgi:uncharacterized protein